VLGIVLGRLPATLELAMLALVSPSVLGGALAVLGTLRRDGGTKRRSISGTA
jgi:ABC-type dipeptide/oligopeptide/nickel transport system permease component